MPKLEQMFVLACFASCLIIISLIEAMLFLSARYNYNLQNSDTNIKYVPSMFSSILYLNNRVFEFIFSTGINCNFTSVALIAATVLCLIGVLFFTVGFYRAASLLWNSIDQFGIEPGWVSGIQFLYCSIGIFTAWLGLMFLFAQYHMKRTDTAWKIGFNSVVSVKKHFLRL